VKEKSEPVLIKATIWELGLLGGIHHAQETEPFREVLERSIGELGLLEPVKAIENPRGAEPKYLVWDGHERLKVSKRLGFTEIPVLLYDLNEKTALLAALACNNVRKRHDFVAFAENVARLYLEHNLKQEEIARLVGCSQSLISKAIEVSRLSPKEKEEIRKRRFGSRQAYERAKKRGLYSPGIKSRRRRYSGEEEDVECFLCRRTVEKRATLNVRVCFDCTHKIKSQRRLWEFRR